MSIDRKPVVKTYQKNDDDKWYYEIVEDGESGSRVGPFPSEQEAIAAGERALADGNDDDAA